MEMLQWLQDLGWTTALRESQYMFPIVEGIHLLGLAFILGPVLMLDFRLTGVLWRDQPVSKIAHSFVPYSLIGAFIMFTTGLLLFAAEPIRSWESNWFKIKIALLLVAGLNALYFHMRTQSGWGAWDNDPIPPRAARMAGLLSILFWAGVVLAGRWTAYSL